MIYKTFVNLRYAKVVRFSYVSVIIKLGLFNLRSKFKFYKNISNRYN